MQEAPFHKNQAVNLRTNFLTPGLIAFFICMLTFLLYYLSPAFSAGNTRATHYFYVFFMLIFTCSRDIEQVIYQHNNFAGSIATLNLNPVRFYV